jgi:inner membrane protein
MPSPIGHALAGLAVGWAVAAPGASPRRAAAPMLCAAIAAAPDLDLLLGIHRMYFHSLGAVFVVLLVARVALGPGQWRLSVAIAAAWGSHLFLDWLGNDTSAPYGLMALWPFSDAYYQSSLKIFDAVSRRYWLPQEFVWHNVAAAAKEIVIVGPFALAAFALARWRQSRA